MMFSRQDWIIVAMLVSASLMLGWLTDAFGWSFAAGVLIWAALQQREKKHLVSWAGRPLARPANVLDSWQALSTALYRTIRNSRERNRTTLTRMRALRLITHVLPDAALVLSPSGEIENLNTAAGKLLNLEAADRGHNLSSLVRQPEFVALLRGRITDNHVEFTSPINDATRLEARRVLMDDGRALVLVRDVTELNRLLSMRQDFIANVSHELRTPLTVIVGYVETLLNEDLDPDTAGALVAKLRPPTSRMRALVDDLLLLTRLEASPNPDRNELDAVAMPGLLGSVVNDGRALSAGRHEITLDVSSRARVIGIENELFSACLNLLTNAVRYSPDGGAVQVSWRDVAGGARFAVQDHGMGIPAEHLSRITERFYRVDLAKSRVRGGTGLGLAIVKHVLKRHNSELQITSRLAEGSTFFCDFPETQLIRTPPSQENR